MSRSHLKCYLWKILWALGVVALLLAWVGVLKRAPILNLDPLVWLWTSLILAAHSIPIKLDCRSCGVCGDGAVSGQ